MLTNILNTDLHSCWAVVNPPPMSLGSGSLSLVGCPVGRFSYVPLSHDAPFLQIPRTCLSRDAAASLLL